MAHIRQNPYRFSIASGLLLIFFWCSPFVVYAQDVVLSWEKPDDSRVTGYKIYYGLQGSYYSASAKIIIDSPQETSCNIADLTPGRIYAFAAKSIDACDNESDFSEIIYYEIPGAASTEGTSMRNPSSTLMAPPGEVSSGGCWLQILSNIFKR
ncbi:MAG: fibronectin type III domain-containing protein [Thermodesulfobacteriota bacterium]|nr:fibronectin type III domain-containing protein [Thermodesulfobacteriota bacterium]